MLRTALRDANEEIGLDPLAVNVLADWTISGHHAYSVRHSRAIPDRDYLPSDEEVAAIVTLPVSELTDLDNYESEHRDHPHYGEIRLHSSTSTATLSSLRLNGSTSSCLNREHTCGCRPTGPVHGVVTTICRRACATKLSNTEPAGAGPRATEFSNPEAWWRTG